MNKRFSGKLILALLLGLLFMGILAGGVAETYCPPCPDCGRTLITNKDITIPANTLCDKVTGVYFFCSRCYRGFTYLPHNWVKLSDGSLKCQKCNYVCAHTGTISNSNGEAVSENIGKWKDGTCEYCGEACNHSTWSNGKCTRCNAVCMHSTANEYGQVNGWDATAGKCMGCNVQCKHKDSVNGKDAWDAATGKCMGCGKVCEHDGPFDCTAENTGRRCSICQMELKYKGRHTFVQASCLEIAKCTNPGCTVTKTESINQQTAHGKWYIRNGYSFCGNQVYYEVGVTSNRRNCGFRCTHDGQNGSGTYVGGKCSLCGSCENHNFYENGDCTKIISCKNCKCAYWQDNHDWDSATGKCKTPGCTVACAHENADANSGNCENGITCPDCKYTTTDSVAHIWDTSDENSVCERISCYAYCDHSRNINLRSCTQSTECSVCHKADALEPTGHDWDNGVCKNGCGDSCDHANSENKPTCTTAADCSICKKTAALAALGHDWDTTQEPSKCTNTGCNETCDHVASTTKPTCTTAADCSICEKTAAHAAIGHDWDNYDCTKPASCKNNCGTNRTAKTAHDWQNGTSCQNKIDLGNNTIKPCSATCNHSKNTNAHCVSSAECSECGNTLNATSHNWVNGKCTNVGCGLICTHSENTNARSCTQSTECSVCRKTDALPATGHDWSNKDGKCANNCGLTCNHSANTNRPTCTASASCSICGKADVLAALGHNAVYENRRFPPPAPPTV